MASGDPLNLDEFSRSGGRLFGRRVERIVVYLDDGGVAKLPGPPPGNDESDDRLLTPMQSDVMAVLEKMKPGERLTNEDIARLSGWANSDDLREFVRKSAAFVGLRRSSKGWQKPGQ